MQAPHRTGRRDFLRFAAAAGLLSQLPPGFANTAAKDAWLTSFNDAMATEPWLKAFRSVTQPAFAANAVMTGQWPVGLTGTLYRNGPARHDIAGYRYHHWFDGDGMLQAWKFTPAGVSHKSRMIETTKYKAEMAAGRALYPGFGSVPPNPAPVSSSDAVNVANISVLPHHGKLLALWEAGSPWEMNPDDLSTVGIHSFNEDTDGVPFSAHPRVEPDGTLWNFGYVSGAGLIALWHINPQGALVKAGTVKVDPMTMPHDFLVTSRHIVLLLPPLHYKRAVEFTSFMEAHVREPNLPTRVLVVDKNDFSKVQWLALPAQWVFHYGNAWEDAQGVIHFDAARAPDPMAMINTFRDVMRGIRSPSSPSLHYRYQIDTQRGKVTEEAMFNAGFNTEFPVIDPRVSTQRSHRLVMLCGDDNKPASHPMLSGVAVYDDRKEKLVTFSYPDHQIPEEHLFVAAPGSDPESAGWIVGSALDVKNDRMLLNVFDVNAPDAGPVATATLPYALPLGLHGKFAAS